MARGAKAIPWTAERIKARSVIMASGCWEWQGYLDRCGYGRTTRRGKFVSAHRLAFEVCVGCIPDGLQIDHLCRNRKCVNPQHLEAVTSRENSLRGIGPAAIHASADHCVHGHLFTKQNTRVARGRRHCRKCEARRSAEYKKRKLA